MSDRAVSFIANLFPMVCVRGPSFVNNKEKGPQSFMRLRPLGAISQVG